MKKTADEFAKIAEKYCLWAESLKENDETDLDNLLIMLSDLFNKALLLPSSDEYLSEDKTERIHHEKRMDIYRNFSPIQFQYYREIFDPHNFDEDEPVTGDLHDDLADIYKDIKPALLLFQQNFFSEAVFEWKFSFTHHWGEHILSAMRAIYMFER